MNHNLIRTTNIIARISNIHNNKKLPTFFFFTDRKKFKDIFKVINHLPRNTAIIIREYDLSYKERLDFANKVKTIAKKKSILVFVAKNLQLALEIKADGIHFTDFDQSWLQYLRYKRLGKKNFLFTCCCHKESKLKKADELGMDVIFYSPIFCTTSHPERRSLGIFNLRKAAKKAKNVIYALGGINERNIRLLKNCNISGVAGISLFDSH